LASETLEKSTFGRLRTHNFSMSTQEENREVDDGIRNDPVVQWTTPLAAGRIIVSNKRKCGLCGIMGHNKRTCPQKVQQGQFIHDDNGVGDKTT
jgi:hypothetical protein